MKKLAKRFGMASIVSICLAIISFIVLGLTSDDDLSYNNSWEDGMVAVLLLCLFAFIVFLVLYIIFAAKLSRQAKKYERVEKIDVSVEEMKKYKELLDSGVITQEEYEAKRKKILDI